MELLSPRVCMHTLLSLFLETANGPSQCCSSFCSSKCQDLLGSASCEKSFQASLMPRTISVSVMFVRQLGFGSVCFFLPHRGKSNGWTWCSPPPFAKEKRELRNGATSSDPPTRGCGSQSSVLCSQPYKRPIWVNDLWVLFWAGSGMRRPLT